MRDLANLSPSESYQYLLQKDTNNTIQDGLGNTFIPASASYSLTASYALNGGGGNQTLQDVTSIGNQTSASIVVIGSLTNGANVEVIGQYSHAEGNVTTAIGAYSHAEGQSTTAIGIGSHAEGLGTIAYGNYSHTEGWGIAATSDYQHVQGKWNIENAGPIWIVGDGEVGDPHNLIEAYPSPTPGTNGWVNITGSLFVSDQISSNGILINGSISVTDGTNSGQAITNITDTFTSTPSVLNIVSLTSAQYTALGVKDSNTLYVII